MKASVAPACLKDQLINLSRELGSAGLSILGEGNTSARLNQDHFFVKASGSNLATLTELELTECRFSNLLSMLDRQDATEAEVDQTLLQARADPLALKPSVETYFHAYLLSLPSINFVAHTHPIPVIQALATHHAEAFANERRFPDEVVCCGPTSLLIPYEDPGLALAQRIRRDAQVFASQHRPLPRVILCSNHGIITLGETVHAVRTAMYMAVKAAQIFVGATQMGGVRPMPPDEVHKIEKRLDEEYRRKMLGLNP